MLVPIALVLLGAQSGLLSAHEHLHSSAILHGVQTAAVLRGGRGALFAERKRRARGAREPV